MDRRTQLRLAKQRQRARDQRAGLGVYQVKLPVADLQRLKAGMKKSGFVERFRTFLRRELIEVGAYPTLKLLCSNRRVEFLTRREAFDLYESNWRLVNGAELDNAERALIADLAREFGPGAINV